MKLHRLLLIVMGLILQLNSFAQHRITGVIRNEDNSPAAYVQVIIYQQPDMNLLTFTTTDIQGQYELNLNDKEGVFLLKTQSMVHESYERDIVIAKEQSSTIRLDIKLDTKLNNLEEIVVHGKLPPIIVKQDTIIYNTAHWTDIQDESLEDVLRKIPGFEIQKDGEIKVDGKIVRKVIVNGQELSDNGAALITKSLSPENIKSIELRTNEKNSKYKNSLLDNNNFVILDIKLKAGIRTDLFGKIKLTAGAQDKLKPGGYTNIFSLTKRVKLHFIAEYDAFGEQSINLGSIKNIGQEAFQKIFEVPADFKRLTENPQFNKELYGFRDYVKNDIGNAGITAAIPLSNKLNLFIGTFNTFNLSQKINHQNQYFFKDDISFLTVNNTSRKYFSSKNKIEFRFDTEKIKAKYNFNIVANQFLSSSQNDVETKNYLFSERNKNLNIYHNLLFEFAPTRKFAFKIEALYNAENNRQNRSLRYDDSVYQSWFANMNNGITSDNFSQLLNNKSGKDLLLGEVQYNSQKGVFSIGLRYLKQGLLVDKQATTELLETTYPLVNSRFQTISPFLKYQQILPFITHDVTFQNLSLNTKIGYGTSFYPNRELATMKKYLWEIKANATYDFSEFDQLRINYSRQMSAFPLYALVEGYDLLDYLTITTPASGIIVPKPESTITLSLSTSLFYKWGIGLEFYNIAGRAENAYRFSFSEAPFIQNNYDQLSTQYFMSGVKFGKIFESLPINILIEPTYLKNINQNIDANETSYTTITDIRMLKAIINSDFKNKPYRFKITSNYNQYRFYNKYFTWNNNNINKMLSLKLGWQQKLFHNKASLFMDIRYVNFQGYGKGANTNMNLGFKIHGKKMKIGFFAYNIFNNVFFSKEGIHPLYQTISNNQLFGRYLKMSVQFKLD